MRTKLDILIVVGRIDGLLPSSDRAAVGQTVALPDVMVSVCDDTDEFATRYALAAGANQVAGLQESRFQIAVFGRGGTQPAGDLLPAKIALTNDANLVFEVLSFQPVGSGLEVVRDLGRGAREILNLKFPVVLVMSDIAESPAYISRFRQQNVALPSKNDSAETKTSNQSDERHRWQSARPRTKTVGLSRKTAGNAQSRMFDAFGLTETASVDGGGGNLIVADPKTCASHLLRYMAHHGFLGTSPQADQWLPESPRENQPQSFESSGLDSEQSRSTTQIRLPLESRLNRRPRPVGQSAPTNVRGPFPVPATPENRNL